MKVEQVLADAVVISQIRSSKQLLSIPDLCTSTRLPYDDVYDSVERLVPDQVRVSRVLNNRLHALYAPAERAPSKREERVGANNPFVRAISRWWYVDVKRIRTCDL